MNSEKSTNEFNMKKKNFNGIEVSKVGATELLTTVTFCKVCFLAIKNILNFPAFSVC